MKRFLTHLLIIATSVLLVNFAYVLIVGGSLRAYAKKYLSFNGDARVLVLGDSHANRAWSKNTEPMTYNFAYESDNITDMASKFDFVASRNLQQGRKAVVLSFDPHLISSYRERKNNNHLNSVLNSSYLNQLVVDALPLIFDPNTKFDLKIFTMRILKRGERVLEGKQNGFDKMKATTRFAEQFPDGSSSTKLLTQYQELITNAIRLGYEIIPVKYPVHPYFDSLIDNSEKSMKLENRIDSLAKAHHLTIIDFSKIVNDKNLFMNQDHVNDAGSGVFIKAFRKKFGALIE